MQVITNEKMITRNARIGSITSLVALGVLGIGLYISFQYKEYAQWSFMALIVGFMLSQVGIYFGNRWGRHPRLDERLTAALKGLSRDYSLYHYMSPVNHLLVGPTGVFLIEPYYQKGKIEFEKGKYKQKGGGLAQSYLKIFAQEGLGRPDLEIRADLDQMKRFFEANGMDSDALGKLKVILAFSHKDAQLIPNDSPYLMLPMDGLKVYFRSLEKDGKSTDEMILNTKVALPKESIV